MKPVSLPRVTWGLVSLALSCGGEPICPSGWVEGENSEGRLTCDPPEGYAEDVAERIGSGFFGFARSCSSDPGSDLADCDVGGLARDEVIELSFVDPAGGELEYVRLEIREDSTFELAGTPGATYSFRGVDATDSIGSSRRPIEEWTLQEGQVVYLRLIVPE